eukprot:CAMPEP_0194218864 /NCGR_PEP_ID=MMETSP0156-20130528/24681_1 /TAXON_ID=33649 /ORGANISM="Thalassionema nitzschioides, Strain L26-B" /LENGTH=794 /DNA_ID=CAMNT_0038948349 /DNA_START=65 /DNA_END=2446 /DNA_ORIENTATION=+
MTYLFAFIKLSLVCVVLMDVSSSLLLRPSTHHYIAKNERFQHLVTRLGIAKNGLTVAEKRRGFNSSRISHKNRESLRWVIEAIERNDENGTPPSDKLLEALSYLKNARTQEEVSEASRLLESISDLKDTESLYVQERLIKATSLAGLTSFSLSLLDESFLKKGKLPSAIAYTAICQALRQTRRLSQLENLLHRLGKSTDDPIDVVALNTFLAGLCDGIKKKHKKNQRVARKKSGWLNEDVDVVNKLEKACKWLSPGYAEQILRSKPDSSSYATVLNAAATIGNRTMATEVWDQMSKEGIDANQYAYNSLIKSMVIGNQASDDEQALYLLEQMRGNPFLQPDRFTVDLVLLPVLRQRGVDEACELVENFIQRYKSSPPLVAEGFASFLDTLTKCSETDAALKIFGTFLLPSLAGSKGKRKNGVDPPTAHHFNIIFNGMNQELKRCELAVRKQKIEEEEFQLRKRRIQQKTAKLYRIMIGGGVQPDSYTVTILLGLSRNINDIIELIGTTSTRKLKERTILNMSPAVLRATMTACGAVNAPSSACWLLGAIVKGENQQEVRTYNTLINALANSARLDDATKLTLETSHMANAFSGMTVGYDNVEIKTLGSFDALYGKTCSEGALSLLKLMDEQQYPRPNSQTYCLVATALQYTADHERAKTLAIELVQNATRSNIPPDGRFINAALRCFGSDINSALKAWKDEIRQFSCLAQQTRTKNLLAAYHGLLYVSGRALRPDIALRICYAMNKENIVVNEMGLQCFRSGQRQGLAIADEETKKKTIIFHQQFDTLLTLECT